MAGLKITYKKENENSPDHESDLTLWSEFKQGDKQAFAIIYRRHFFKLYDYGVKISGNPELVKDCIQELFIAIWKSRNNLAYTDSIKNYLFTSLRRKLFDQLKKHKLLSAEKKGNTFAFSLPREHALIMEEISLEKKRKLLDGINRLSKRQKEAIFLRYYEGFTCDEIARIMSLSPGSTYVLLSKAISQLKKQMDKILSVAVLLRSFIS